MYIQVRNEGFICDTYFDLQSLLVDPDLSCQVNEQAADLFNSTEIAYKQKVKTIARRRLEGWAFRFLLGICTEFTNAMLVACKAMSCT
jgi:hypothetical protein